MATLSQLPKPVTDLLEDSKAAAKEKNYDVALKAVNEALKIADKSNLTPSLVISLLDYRHAIFVRKDDLESALKDAKSMIRLGRHDARGYIRCGTVQTLKGDKTATLKYLEHGLKNVPPSDPNLALLMRDTKKTRDQISAELVVSRARDPMTTLPAEIIEFIMSYLDYRQHVQLLGVSRPWKKVLSAMPPLTDTLAFPRTKKPITPKMLLATLRRLKFPRHLSARDLSLPSTSILLDRLRSSQSWRSLESLEIDDKHIQLPTSLLAQWNLRTITIEAATATKMDWVFKLLESCSRLEVAHLRGVGGLCDTLILSSKSLVELELTYAGLSGLVSANLSRLVDITVLDLPRIRKLHLAGFVGSRGYIATALDLQHLKELETLSFQYCGTSNIRLPPQIKHLEMNACQFLHEERTPGGQPQSTIYPPLDNLESLTLSNSQANVFDIGPYPHFIRHAASQTKPGTLTSLSISHNPAWPATFSSMLSFPWFQGLKALRVDGPDIKDEHSQVVMWNCPVLETLHISNAAITGVFLSDLIKAPESRLRKVTVDKCAKVSRDIVPWAKERGVEVEYIAYTETLVGRRVRERD